MTDLLLEQPAVPTPALPGTPFLSMRPCKRWRPAATACTTTRHIGGWRCTAPTACRWPSRSAIRRFLTQFDNLLIYVLLVPAGITLALGYGIDAAVILAVVILNAAIGFVQEGRAERALDAIRGMLPPQASVMRVGRRLTVEAETLVPGDVVLLDPGDRVAADLRFLQTRNLGIEEAAPTGESVPVDKCPAPVAAETPLV